MIFANIITFITHMSTDLLFAVLVFVLAAGATLYIGSSVAINLILSWYVALTIFRNIPLTGISTIGAMGIFVGCIAVTYFVLRKVVNVYETYMRKRKILRAVMLAACITALVFITLIYVVPITDMHVFSPIVRTIFGQSLLVYWLSVPVIALYITYRI